MMDARAGLLLLLSTGFIPSIPAYAGKPSVLHLFSGRDGAVPVSGVVADRQGNLYGETVNGGKTCFDGNTTDKYGCGTIYEITSRGKFKTLVTFAGAANGAHGVGGLTLSNGTLYGTAEMGGTNGDGVVFSLKPDGSQFAVLHSFAGADGKYPIAALRLDAPGVLVGTTALSSTDGTGVFFKILLDGTFTSYPLNLVPGAPSDIVLSSKTIAYGVTGSFPDANSVCGVIYKFDIGAGISRVLYDFAVDPNGSCLPRLGGIDSSGNLIGTTFSGKNAGAGGEAPMGSIFKLSPAGAKSVLTTLWAFTGGRDGELPLAGPQVLADGSLIGSTSQGAGTHQGAFYKYSAGSLQTVYSFDNSGQSTYGIRPSDAPIAVGGAVVGTVASGGNVCMVSGGIAINGCGSVVSIVP